MEDAISLFIIDVPLNKAVIKESPNEKFPVISQHRSCYPTGIAYPYELGKN